MVEATVCPGSRPLDSCYAVIRTIGTCDWNERPDKCRRLGKADENTAVVAWTRTIGVVSRQVGPQAQGAAFGRALSQGAGDVIQPGAMAVLSFAFVGCRGYCRCGRRCAVGRKQVHAGSPSRKGGCRWVGKVAAAVCRSCVAAATRGGWTNETGGGIAKAPENFD